ncbi:MAG: hypothetical protein HKL95_01475 [Phycisphaerae bacterium]|nr:hypothetical protein [Phycisphaerae bacterium]
MATLARLAIKDKFAPSQNLKKLRAALNGIQGLGRGRFQIHNRVRLRKGGFTLTDFFLEVDENLSSQVKKAVEKAGFGIRGDPAFKSPAARKGVAKLVARHLQAAYPPDYAIWFGLASPSNIHLREISRGISDPGDGSLMGVPFGAEGVPNVKSVALYPACPAELRKAFRVHPAHPAVAALRCGDFQVVHAKDGLARFRQYLKQLGVAKTRAGA